MSFKKNFNIELGDIVVKNAGEKIGSLFGKGGKLLGIIIDTLTKDVTIKIGDKESDRR